MNLIDFVATSLGLSNVKPTIPAGEVLNIIVLTATLFVLVVYTIASLGLWKEAHFQTHLSISPFLLFEIGDENQFFIKNVGKSAAFNVNMESLYISVQDTSPKKLFQLVFDQISIIEAKDRKVLRSRSYQDGKETKFDISSHLNPKYQTKSNYRFTLSYTNAIGLRYFTTFDTGKDGIKVLRISRQRLWHRLFLQMAQRTERLRLKLWGHRLT